MSSKLNRPQRRLDDKTGVTLGGGGIIETGGGAPSPGIVILTAPQSFTIVSTALAASLLVPKAIANTTWKRPLAPGPVGSYLIQWSLSSSFTTPTGIPVPGTQTSAAIGDLPCGLTVYFRIAAIAAGGVQGAWSATVSTLTPSDTTPPAAPTSLTTAWSGLTGDLDIRWTNPTSANFAYVRIQIYASNGGALLRTEKSVTGRYVWSRAQQYADTAGAYDPSVYLVLTSVSVGGILSATTLTGTATLSVPGTPSGLTTNWASDTGTAAADCLITWTASAGVALYRLSIDGVAHDVVGGRYLYTFDNNRAEHSGTPDAALSLSLVAVDALGQSSTAATTTATNAAPPATTISAFGAFTMVSLTIGASAAQDFDAYRVRVYVASVLERTLWVTAPNTTYAVEDGNGNYTFDVAVRDKFGQIGTASSQTAPVELVDQTEFIADLRAGMSYRDSIPTTPATLDGLKDDDTSTNVVTYAASASAWRWTEGIRALEVRHRKSTLSTSASASYYYGVSLDGVTYTWYAGGTATGGVWAPVAQASEAAAKTAATTLAAGIWRITLAATVEARFFRLGHRNTTTSYALREFYPRSLVEADDINVESLSAISANLGTIMAGSITGVTITGGTIRTAASGARVELTSTGLKTYDSTGTVVIEATTATDGALIAGVGALTINNDGIAIRDSLGSPITFLDDAALTENGVIYSNGTNAEFIVQGRTGCRLYLEANNGLLHQLEIGTVSGSEALATFSHSVKVTRFLRLGSTAFPASPNTNDLYYRTDLDMLCFYDGVRWLTAHEYSADFMLFDSSPPFSAAGTTVYAWAPRLDYSLYITQARALTQVAATNNGSNYWTISLYRDNTAIWTFNTSADTAATLYNKTSAINAVHTPTTWMRYRIDSDTGPAGNINMSVTLYYRLVIT